MQENNTIYEITQKMQNKNNLQNDMKEAFELITNLFKEKYFNKLEFEITQHINSIKNNPSNEIKLLNAFKPFLNNNTNKNIENIINTLTNLNAFNTLKTKIYSTKNLKTINYSTLNIQKDPSIKEDGVYDIDESCLILNQNFFNVENFNILLILFFIILLVTN